MDDGHRLHWREANLFSLWWKGDLQSGIKMYTRWIKFMSKQTLPWGAAIGTGNQIRWSMVDAQKGKCSLTGFWEIEGCDKTCWWGRKILISMRLSPPGWAERRGSQERLAPASESKLMAPGFLIGVIIGLWWLSICASYRTRNLLGVMIMSRRADTNDARSAF